MTNAERYTTWAQVLDTKAPEYAGRVLVGFPAVDGKLVSVAVPQKDLRFGGEDAQEGDLFAIEADWSEYVPKDIDPNSITPVTDESIYYASDGEARFTRRLVADLQGEY